MPGQPLSVAIHGATGRMGTRLIQLIVADTSLELGSALVREGHPDLGRDVGPMVGLGELGVPLRSGLSRLVDVLIDFSSPSGAESIAVACRSRGIPILVGTTGLEPEQRRSIEAAGEAIPVLIAPNTSRAVNLLFKLAGDAARALGPSADVEIVERHHRLKKDAPSGTAIRLADVIANETGATRRAHGRSGVVGERPRDEIGIHALRTGDNPGEHTVVFGLMGECIELSHRALNRDGFARGALDAAMFLARQPAGVYSMADVLG